MIGVKFIRNSGACLILGHNRPYANLDFFQESVTLKNAPSIFGDQGRHPDRYGGVQFGLHRRALSLEDKPKPPKTHFAVPGPYVYDAQVVEVCKQLKPSGRGDLEITDLNLLYLKKNELHVKLLSRGMAWLDTGTQTSLLEAGNYIATIEHRQGLKVACLEEVALRMGFIDRAQVEKTIDRLPKGDYRDYLRLVCEEPVTTGIGPVG